MNSSRVITLLWCMLVMSCSHKVPDGAVEITEEMLRDKINGGIIGQFFGNLNGLVHENQYTIEPGNVETYIPDLSDGAFTDDDTDIEFMYIYHMLKSGRLMLDYDEIFRLWLKHINDKIWCSNRYARNLMEIGIHPPHTGSIAFNPWAGFNISGQFLSEEFALIAPGMPQTAARIGTHYTHVAIDGEPLQTTQLYDAMIATAFFAEDHMEVIRAGLAAVDPESEIREIVSHVIAWYRENPEDWRKTRLAIRDEYWNGTFGGPGGTNGYRVITAATIASILYGEGDFVETIRQAFNFGWDADNVAAMAGTIMGVLKGEKWIRSQGWKIRDAYTNNRRPGLPTNLTITGFADMHFQVARNLILERGGKAMEINGQPGFLIPTEAPANVEKLPRPLHRIEALRQQWWPVILDELAGDSLQMVRAVYTAICLDLVREIHAERAGDWLAALPAIRPYYKSLCGDGQWSAEAKAYFHDVVYNRNTAPDCPFGYGRYAY